MIRRHFQDLLENPTYRHAIIRVFIEANSSFYISGEVARMVTRLDPFRIECVRFDAAGRLGVWTSHTTKEAMCYETRNLIGGTHFAEDESFISAKPHDTRACLLTQMGQFRVEVEAPADGIGSATQSFFKIRYTGKGGGQKDDLFMAYGIATHYAKYSIEGDHAFQARCRQHQILMD